MGKDLLKDKVALVTGAGDGIGRAIALRYAAEGASVVVAEINESKGQSTVDRIVSGGGKATLVAMDVRRSSEHARLIEKTLSTYGRLDVACNNAGISGAMVPALEMTDTQWQDVIDINLTGVFLGVRAQVGAMLESGGGSIVNISSTAGLVGHPGVAYAASKWGLRGVTKSTAMEMLEWNVRVNSVHPAQVSETGMSANATPGYRYANERAMPMKRASRPDEVAQAVLFLASDESSYINASEIVVDGGAVAIGLPRVRTLLEEDFNRGQAVQ